MGGSLTMTVYSDGAPTARRPAAPARADHRDRLRARYDNATTTPENQRHWAATDYFSAKAANSFQVRRILRMRSRYEVSNNPYLFGICNGNADDLIDTGPTLQVRTSDAGYNRAVEAAWKEWADEVGLVEKLRTNKLAKSVDGEGFTVLKTVEDLEQPVKLYPCDVEADQVTTPAPTSLTDFWVDGLTLHKVTGRPIAYHVLRNHPGDFFFPDFNPLAVDKILARHVIHWFGKFRPGQVRGIPVFTSSLDLFTELRAYRRAVLRAAEVAADLSAVAESDFPAGADGEDQDTGYEPFKSVPTQRGMIVTLPAGMKLNAFDPKQPTTNYGDYHERGVGEACRPLAYPLNLALGTSQRFNFSSAKLDHINYRNSLRVERADCEAVVLRKLFRAWYEEAVLCGAIPMSQGLTVPPHEWHWPGFASIDPAADSAADAAQLAAGTDTYRDFWARRGYDWRDVMAQQAAEKDELKKLGLQFGEPVAQTITDDGDKPAKAGRRMTHWLRAEGKHDESKHPRAADGKFGSGGGHATGSVHDSPKDLAHRAGGLAARIKTFRGKAVAAAKAVKERAVHAAFNATWAVASAKVRADDVLDTAHDYSKIINDKAVSSTLGVSGNTVAVAVAASHVLAYGIVKAKAALANRRDKSSKSGTGRRGWVEAGKSELADKAEAVADFLREVLPALGVKDEDLPTAADVAEYLHHTERADDAHRDHDEKKAKKAKSKKANASKEVPLGA